jgi:hypothetical protein
MKRFAIGAALAATLLTSAATAAANDGSLANSFNPVSPQSQQIRQQPILERPDRPGHFYGNTVRRMHRRGNPLPLPRDFSGWWGR